MFESGQVVRPHPQQSLQRDICFQLFIVGTINDAHATAAAHSARELLDSAAIQLTEARTEIQDYLDSVEINPERLAEVELELAEPSVWDDPARAQELGKERSSLEGIVTTIETLDANTADSRYLCHTTCF